MKNFFQKFFFFLEFLKTCFSYFKTEHSCHTLISNNFFRGFFPEFIRFFFSILPPKKKVLFYLISLTDCATDWSILYSTVMPSAGLSGFLWVNTQEKSFAPCAPPGLGVVCLFVLFGRREGLFNCGTRGVLGKYVWLIEHWALLEKKNNFEIFSEKFFFFFFQIFESSSTFFSILFQIQNICKCSSLIMQSFLIASLLVASVFAQYQQQQYQQQPYNNQQYSKLVYYYYNH